MPQAMVILNPSSGKEEALNHLQRVEELLQEQGYEVSVKETAKELDATHFCIEACRNKYDLIVSIGGDGTLHETINGFTDQNHRPKLGIVPLGTVNDYARALNIPLDAGEAIETLRSKRVKAVDMGRVNGERFANVVAAGSLAESLSAVTSEDKSRLGAFAYLKEGIKDLMNHSTHPLIIRHDGGTWEGDSPLLLVTLTNSVGGFEKLAPDAEVDDGLLHCFVIRDLSIFHTVTAGLSLLLGHLKNHKDVDYFTSRKVTVSSPDPVKTNVDGEEGPMLPLELGILPRYLQVIIPEEG
ncbi:diacylglycerol kinase family lipid kinase [Paenibacillus sp. CC-CFT747]|nr:diacylglycerol kinase family lipid kinase [Paenibacillus sp. CC-CFT747]